MRGVGIGELVEAGDGEEHVLVRVKRGVFVRRAGERAGGQEEARHAREMPI